MNAAHIVGPPLLLTYAPQNPTPLVKVGDTFCGITVWASAKSVRLRFDKSQASLKIQIVFSNFYESFIKLNIELLSKLVAKRISICATLPYKILQTLHDEFLLFA